MKRRLLIILIAFIPFVLLDRFFGGHGEFPWPGILGFFALFGLIGCVAIVLISKWLGHHWLQRKEDYYERNDGDR